MLKAIKGYVIHTTDYGDSSRILNVLTEDGIIGIISKGCKNVKSSLRLVSQKLIYGEFVIYEKEKGLSTLKEGTILNEFNNIKKDITRFSYYSYITELTSQVMKESNNKSIYNLFNETVLKIEEGLNPKVMTNILELKLLNFIGVPLNLTECVKCGSKKDIITINPDEGGLICKSCYTNEIIYDLKVLKMLRNYSLVDIKTIKELKISDELIEFINRIISQYYDRYTGIYVHSKKFLEKLDNLNLK